MIWEWEYFEPEELLSPQGLLQFKTGNLLLQHSAINKLHEFRKLINRPFLINHAGLKYRGYRSPAENQRLGGALFSRHVQGIAFDITPVNMKLKQFRDLAIDFGWGGVGYYPKNNFVHVDDRTIIESIITWEQ